ncbi:hypothetical protein RR48_13628 [Papilio machaon]|uniref:Uncharacterized protein n=1 Tax=Papilio machaon TaxID=76193 RepID=A0A194RAB2_PAPMA|nr:hypothetical protein RR48_13628 [Papilio machaon]
MLHCNLLHTRVVTEAPARNTTYMAISSLQDYVETSHRLGIQTPFGLTAAPHRPAALAGSSSLGPEAAAQGGVRIPAGALCLRGARPPCVVDLLRPVDPGHANDAADPTAKTDIEDVQQDADPLWMQGT